MVRVGMMVAVMNPRLERSRPRNARRTYANPGRALLGQHLLAQRFPFGDADDIGENHYSTVRSFVCSFFLFGR
jgi:hypothetical protein